MTERHKKEISEIQGDYNFMMNQRVQNLNYSDQSSDLDWISRDSKTLENLINENRLFDQNMNLISSERGNEKDAVLADELYQARARFLKELRALEGQYELKMKERTKEILNKVKEEYKPLITDLKRKNNYKFVQFNPL